jgi:hypothetical protein
LTCCLRELTNNFSNCRCFIKNFIFQLSWAV